MVEGVAALEALVNREVLSDRVLPGRGGVVEIRVLGHDPFVNSPHLQALAGRQFNGEEDENGDGEGRTLRQSACHLATPVPACPAAVVVVVVVVVLNVFPLFVGVFNSV